MTGIAIFAHGSSVETANEAVRQFTAGLARYGQFDLIETSFLELGNPGLPEAVRRLVERGATEVVVVPYFLTLGIHLKRDLPRIVGELRNIYVGIRFDIAEPMDGHPALLEVLLDRAKEVLHGGSGTASAAD
jgi:sirohydrochlorin ferrochelatase